MIIASALEVILIVLFIVIALFVLLIAAVLKFAFGFIAGQVMVKAVDETFGNNFLKSPDNMKKGN
jgi:zinc transporter ZupT